MISILFKDVLNFLKNIKICLIRNATDYEIKK